MIETVVPPHCINTYEEQIESRRERRDPERQTYGDFDVMLTDF